MAAVMHDSSVVDHERAEVHEVAHRRMHAGFGDHRAAVGVAEQHAVAVEAVEHLPYARRVGVQVTERTRVVAVAREDRPRSPRRPRRRSARRTRSKHQAPCHAPWTSTTDVVMGGQRARRRFVAVDPV